MTEIIDENKNSSGAISTADNSQSLEVETLDPHTELQKNDEVDFQEPVKRLYTLAKLMDSQFKIPFIGSIGLDPIIGLVPVVGDIITYFVSGYIIVQAGRLGMPASKIARMSLNTFIDVLAGYVPFIGDLVDATYKSNARNVNIILDHFGAEIDDEKGVYKKLPVKSVLSPKAKIIAWIAIVVVILLLLALLSIPFLLIILIFNKN